MRACGCVRECVCACEYVSVFARVRACVRSFVMACVSVRVCVYV